MKPKRDRIQLSPTPEQKKQILQQAKSEGRSTTGFLLWLALSVYPNLKKPEGKS